ncbi:hypothetical protein C8R43DRAFT_955838 [Mycena crocata]|nr:hypothetical protein C8R43DRAFT_955838 [Mycena crocata]
MPLHADRCFSDTRGVVRAEKAAHSYGVFKLPKAENSGTCITPEQPPKNPCARCIQRNLSCEYVAAPEPDYYCSGSSSHGQSPPDYCVLEPSDLRTKSARPSTPITWTSPDVVPSFPPGPAPPLPYTAPPPPYRTPRFPGSNYPDLSLQGPPQQYIDPRQLMLQPSPPFPNYLTPSTQRDSQGSTATDPSRSQSPYLSHMYNQYN